MSININKLAGELYQRFNTEKNKVVHFYINKSQLKLSNASILTALEESDFTINELDDIQFEFIKEKNNKYELDILIKLKGDDDYDESITIFPKAKDIVSYFKDALRDYDGEQIKIDIIPGKLYELRTLGQLWDFANEK
jgi:hypothetical protein